MPKIRSFIWNSVFTFTGRCCIARPSFLVSLAILSFSFAANAEIIDRVAASVNNEVITLSELDKAARFNAALSGNDENESKLRMETLEGLVNRRLLLQEAYRMRFVEVSEEDINAEISKLKSRIGTDEEYAGFLTGLNITEEELGVMLGERLLVQRFVEKKIGLFVRVSREEAQLYFNDHLEDFKGKQFPEVQKSIIAALSERKLEQQTAKYLDELRSKAAIRVNQ